MMRKQSKGASFADLLVVGGGSSRLDRISGLLDCGRLEALLSAVYATERGSTSYTQLVHLRVMLLKGWDGLRDPGRVEALLGAVYAAERGRPSYPPLVHLRVLLLQGWYGLSDPGMEEALGDRLSFRRFAGLGLDERVPDHSSISRFRTLLARQGLAEQLFAEVVRQLDAKGV